MFACMRACIACMYMYVSSASMYVYIRRQQHWGGGVNQAYSRLSTTHGHITDCKLDSGVYAGVCVVI